MLWCYPATLIRVIDGDTFDVLLYLGDGVYRSPRRIRLLGINCPEPHGETLAAGVAATAFTAQWLGDHDDAPLQIFSERESFAARDKIDSFERLLARVYSPKDGACLNDALLTSNHATIYRKRAS